MLGQINPPGIATSISIVTGCVYLELYKVLGGGHHLEDYRHSNIHLSSDGYLGVANFRRIVPEPARVMEYSSGES